MIVEGASQNAPVPILVNSDGSLLVKPEQVLTILPTIGGIYIPEFLLDAGTGNTLLGLRIIVNPLDIVDATDSLHAKSASTLLIQPRFDAPIMLSCDVPISSIALLCLATATGALSSTPASTLFGVAPSESTYSNISTAMRLMFFDGNTPGKRLTLTMTPAYASARYSTMRVEVGHNG